ncbi:hypothetical protein TrVE_jg171, partial [Triparma verrucosa]
YGYVTSCPSNLGTGMRASVHVKIPNLTADGTDKKAKVVCKPLGLSVRGTGGEHTPIGADGTVDISPSNRLFIKECEIIARLYEGIKLLMNEENKGPSAPPKGEVIPGLVKKAKDILTRFPDNRCCKYLIPYLGSAEGKALSDEDFEVFRRCVQTGIDNEDSGLGCYAMQPDD